MNANRASSAQVHQRATIVDLHIHPSMSQQIFRRDIRFTDLKRFNWDLEPVRSSFPRMKRGGYDAFLSVLHVPERGLLNDFPLLRALRLLHPTIYKNLIDAEPFDALMRIMDDIETTAENSTQAAKVQVVRNRAELRAVLARPRDERPMALIHAVEGGHVLGTAETPLAEVLKRLETLFHRGVSYLTLAHFYDNVVTHPCYPFPDRYTELAELLKGDAGTPAWRNLTLGLTDKGNAVVQRMMDLGMLIDLSHCTPAARRDVYAMADAQDKRVPLLMTHVGAYSVNPSPYNPSDWEIKRIAQSGGVIGVIFMNFWLTPSPSKHTINAVAQSIDHLLQIGGEDHVGIGTDFDGFTDPPEDLANAGLMERLTERLLAMGYAESTVHKILGLNALRVLEDAWGA